MQSCYFGGIRTPPVADSPFHAVDRGSNPLGDAKRNQALTRNREGFFVGKRFRKRFFSPCFRVSARASGLAQAVLRRMRTTAFSPSGGEKGMSLPPCPAAVSPGRVSPSLEVAARPHLKSPAPRWLLAPTQAARAHFPFETRLRFQPYGLPFHGTTRFFRLLWAGRRSAAASCAVSFNGKTFCQCAHWPIRRKRTRPAAPPADSEPEQGSRISRCTPSTCS